MYTHYTHISSSNKLSQFCEIIKRYNESVSNSRRLAAIQTDRASAAIRVTNKFCRVHDGWTLNKLPPDLISPPYKIWLLCDSL